VVIRRTLSSLLVVGLLLAGVIAPISASGSTCFRGSGFGWRDGHHYVYFFVNMSSNHWEIRKPWYYPFSASLWSNPNGDGYAEAGFQWINGLSVVLKESDFLLCGSV